MYEMLALPEEALIQYDELDALFTQFAVNHIVGGYIDFFVESYFVCLLFLLWFSSYKDSFDTIRIKLCFFAFM